MKVKKKFKCPERDSERTYRDRIRYPASGEVMDRQRTIRGRLGLIVLVRRHIF